MAFFDFFRKKNKPSRNGNSHAGQVETQPTKHCFVICEREFPLTLDHANQVVQEILGPDHSADVGEELIVTINRGSQTIGFLAHMPAAIPGDEASENADGNFLWPNGKEEASKHCSHVIVTNMGGKEENPIQSALSVTRLALVALQLFDGMGVYWGNACVTNSRDLFESFCEDISEDHLPVPVWLRFQLRSQGKNKLGLYTLGMQQFGLMDIEIDECNMDVQEIFEFVSNIAHYLIQSGPVIADGNTVGGSEEERILVRHRPSVIDKNRLVYKIIFDS